ncbi:MAG: hypothetical protein ABI183_00235 [Polyangiaceae bacterium]
MFGEERASWRKSCEVDGVVADIWLVPPQCAGLRIVGHLDVAAAKRVVALMMDAFAATPDGENFTLFCDYSALTGADPDARTILQDAVKKHKDRFHVIHYLVPSKLIAAAVQVSGLWHGIPTKTWTSRARMELELVRTGGK